MSSLPRVIVMAGGAGQRWTVCRKENPEQKWAFDKLDAPIDDVPLIQRTRRMLADLGVTPLFCGGSDRLRQAGDANILASTGVDIADAVCGTAHLWDGPVRILLGDVVWSRAALATVLAPRAAGWHVFGKLGGNRFTGKKWCEIYALAISPECEPQLLSSAERLRQWPGNRKKLWELYRLMLGETLPEVPSNAWLLSPPASPHFVEIDDWTDDIDTPQDYVAILTWRRDHPEMLGLDERSA